ncbi:MAG: DUF11 domain-containing protein, partial [Hyphomicrobiales bacterium]|nr:DUF11 domain-containing protein [Hyphomicrobiales bacterium]
TCPALPAGGLAPGASITCTGSYTVTQADLDAGSITNVASAKSGTTTSPVDQHTINAANSPALTIAKSGSPANFSAAGAVISYTYKVTNSGNVTLTNAVTVSDNKIASVTCPALPAGGLAPGAFITCTGSYTTTQADVDAGGVTNTASAKAGTIQSPTVSLTTPSSQSPALSLIKSSTATGYASVGQTIPYTFQVTNAGNTTLTSAVTVSDSKIASVTCPALPAGGLAPGGSIACTGSYIVTQADLDAGAIVNTASAKSGATSSTPTTHTLPATQSPALTVAKTASPGSFAAAGATINYAYKVTNAGNTTLTSAVTVADNKIASVTCPALPAGGLAPGASITCTGSYTTTQADVDAGGVTNIASAKSGATTSPTTSATATSAPTPALSMTKTASPTSVAAAGAVVSYSYNVTNAGNVTLTNAITVSDNKIATVSCPSLPAGGLAPGAFITCTGSYTVTQADVDAGGVTNVASAKSGATTSTPASATVTAAPAPALGIVKSSSPANFTTAGATINYAYKVTNAGNVTLTNAITVSDNKIASVACPALPAGGLAPGASITCAAAYTTTQADVDGGGVTNVASAKSGATTSTPATLTVSSNPNASLALVKSTTMTGFATVGQSIPYTFQVTNAGSATLTSPVSVTDSKIASVTCPALPAGGLAPGGSITCTGSYTVTQADLDAGSITNTASAKSGTTVSANESHTINATQTPAMTIAKTPSPTTFTTAGTVVSYSYKVTNSGNVTLTNAVTVSDNKIASVTCPALPAGGLAPGAFITCTGSYTTTQADVDAGGVTNTASARSGATTSPTVSATATSTSGPALSMTKTPSPATAANAGASVTFAYKVTNTGNVTLTSAVSVNDNKIASVSCPALPAGGLAPGGSITCTATYVVTQADMDAGSVTNIATASSGATVSPAASATVTTQQTPALSIAKSASPTTFNAVGASITYSYKVTNTGNVTLTNAITVSDNKIASVTCPALPAGGLAPGAFITCTGSYTTTQADLDAGSVTNVASAKSGATVSAVTQATVTAAQAPALTIAKSADRGGFTAAGQTIVYSYLVTNSGNVDLTSPVSVSDNKIAAVSCPALPAGGLKPGASITCTGSYTTTAGDVAAGAVANTASATSGSTVSPSVTLSVPSAKIKVVEDNNPHGVTTSRDNGDGTFTTSFVVTIANPSSAPLTDVKLKGCFGFTSPPGQTIPPCSIAPDVSIVSATITSETSSTRGPLGTTNPSFTATSFNPDYIRGPGETLAPGESITFVYTVTYKSPPQSLYDAVVVTGCVQTASGACSLASDAVDPSSSAASIGTPSSGPLTVTKSTPRSEITRGEVVPYTITVQNNQNQLRDHVTLVDMIPAGFAYKVRSASIAGVAREPAVAGRQLTWTGLSIAPRSTVTVKLMLAAGSGLGFGEYANQAWLTDASGSIISNIGQANVRLIGDPTFDCSDIIGKVFDDKNSNGYQDEGEPGIANVRLATVRGQLITTDSEGRFHIACADVPSNPRGTNYILKLDERSLPTGYRVTTENPRVIRITPGKMAKINFGAALQHVVRLDLMDAAFRPGATALAPQWAAQMPRVIEALRRQTSILRLYYRRSAREDGDLAVERMRALEEAIQQAWRQAGAPYDLKIETTVTLEAARSGSR